MKTIHVLDVNMVPLCGDDAPLKWNATALSLKAAKELAGPHDELCQFCVAAVVGVDVARAKGGA